MKTIYEIFPSLDVNKDKDLINKVKEKVFKYDYLTGCIKEKGILVLKRMIV